VRQGHARQPGGEVMLTREQRIARTAAARHRWERRADRGRWVRVETRPPKWINVGSPRTVQAQEHVHSHLGASLPDLSKPQLALLRRAFAAPLDGVRPHGSEWMSADRLVTLGLAQEIFEGWRRVLYVTHAGAAEVARRACDVAGAAEIAAALRALVDALPRCDESFCLRVAVREAPIGLRGAWCSEHSRPDSVPVVGAARIDEATRLLRRLAR
jgi:hypothetical protein